MNRREFVKAIGYGALGLTASGCSFRDSIPGAIKPMKKPNIVLIAIDDMGWADIGYHNPEIKSPHLDRLAREGVELDQHYVQPQCTPTRVALMTGRYPSRFGKHCTTASNLQSYPLGTVTLASALRSVGYDTAITGKWHMGSKFQWGPRKYGFNYAHGSLAGATGMYDHRYRLNSPYTQTWYRDEQYLEQEGHVYDLCTNEAVEWIEKTLKTPFFLYLPYQGVHTPLVEKEKWLNINSHIDNPSRRLFAAAVSHLDHQIGRIIDALDRTGQRENTLIICFSDNGGYPNYPGGNYPQPDPKLTKFSSNAPLRGQKTQVYEGGIRVPAFVNWPGKLKPNKVTAPLHVSDWMPTLCELVGYHPGEDLQWDGQNVWPFITGQRKNYDQPRLIYTFWGNQNEKSHRIALRQGDWKLVHPRHGQPAELYHLADDPNEKNNLARKRPQQLKRLRQLLEQQQARDAQGPAPWLNDNNQ